MSEFSPNIPLHSFEVQKKPAEAIPLDREDELTLLEAKEALKLERREHFKARLARRMMGRIAIAATMIATSIIGSYMENVHENEAREAAAQISLQEILKGDGVSETYYGDGFNIKKSTYLTEKLGPIVQQVDPGGAKAINSGDAVLSPSDVAENVKEDVKINNFNSVSFVGESLGGRMVLSAAAEFSQNSTTPIKAIFLGSTPANMDCIQPSARSYLNTLTSFVAPIPYSEHSDWVKFGVTVAMHKDQFAPGNDFLSSLKNFDVQEFGSSVSDSWQLVQDRERPDISMLESQISLAKSNIEDDIAKIAHGKSGYKPTIIYWQLEGDQTVDNEKSAKIITELGKKYGITVIVVPITVGGHGMYGEPDVNLDYKHSLSADGQGPEVEAALQKQQHDYAVQQWASSHPLNQDSLSFKKTPSNSPTPNPDGSNDGSTVAEK